MSELKIIGAGLWRTGTSSLQVATEQFTHEKCYKMYDLMMSSAKTSQWLDILDGKQPDWHEIFSGYGSTLDWPSLAYWEEIYGVFPGAYILLSHRDPESWWNSISNTVLLSSPTEKSIRRPWDELVVQLFKEHFVGRHPKKEEAIKFYLDHNDYVRKTVEPSRLIDWNIDDGWAPICKALGLDIPSNKFPHIGRTDDYRRMNRLPPT